MKFDITIRDHKTGAYLQIPVLPPSIPYQDGEAIFDLVKILNVGTISFPNGVELDSLTIDSFFPGKYDPYYCNTSDLLKPLEYRNRFSGWKDGGNILQMIIPAAGVNKPMRVKSFTPEHGKGSEGDIYYSLTFEEAKTVAPKKLTPGGKIPPVNKKAAADRAAAPQKTLPKTYTVQAGDTLYLIAKRLGIADWYNRLYLPNKAVIGSDPGKIYPGQVLKL